MDKTLAEHIARDKAFRAEHARKQTQATPAEAAEHLDLSVQRFGTLVRQGVITMRKTYNLDVVRTEYLEHLTRVAAHRQAEVEATRAKVELVRVQADSLAFKNARLREAHVSREVVIRDVARDYGAVRARFGRLPGDVSEQLVGLDRAEIHVALRDAIYSALDELAAGSDIVE